MGARNEELVVTWSGYKHTFGEYDQRVEIGSARLECGKEITAKISCQEGELLRHGTYRLFGHFMNHHRHGEQYVAKSWVEEQPASEESILAYLTQCKGPGKGSITHRIAVKLFEKFGENCINVLITAPAEAAEGIPRWDVSKAAIASKFLEAQDYKRVSKLQLMSLFEGRGFPRKSVDRAIRKFGISAGQRVRKDPYILMELPGIGFNAADKLYSELAREAAGTDNVACQETLASIHRQGLCLCYEVSQERSGSTWMMSQIAMAGVRRNVSDSRAKPEDALKWAVMESRLVTYEHAGAVWVANARRALHEREISWFLESSDREHCWPTIESIQDSAPEGKPLSDHQVTQTTASLSHRIGCLQGSPGVGKTFVLACLVKAIIHDYGEDSIAVACPTGKAAVRAAQALFQNDVDLDVKTVHRLLGVDSASDGGWQFHHNETNPLPYRFMIIDESSMLDVDLLASLFRACTAETHFLFVGDINQLAPVGHGRPFQDMQQLVPTGHLTEIRRNSGRIVQACAEIRDHKRFSPSQNLDVDAGENMPLIELEEPDQQVNAVENLIRMLGTQDVLCHPVWDIQVVTALNNKSPVSREPLNELLQGSLNPDGEKIKGNPFRVNDKVVCLKNGTYQDAYDRHEKHFVANGELAQVMALNPGRMTLRLFDPDREIIVPHSMNHDPASGESDSDSENSKGAVGDWDLGYVLSCHRSQGSQWKYVIVMIDSNGSASHVQSRNWLYTAISRAEVATFVLGRRDICQRMMSRDGTSDRKTFLVERTMISRDLCLANYETLFAKV